MTTPYERPEHDPDEVPHEEQLDVEAPNEGATAHEPDDEEDDLE